MVSSEAECDAAFLRPSPNHLFSYGNGTCLSLLSEMSSSVDKTSDVCRCAARILIMDSAVLFKKSDFLRKELKLEILCFQHCKAMDS